MANLIIPEDLKEMVEELVAYEDVERITEEELNWAQEWLYINLPEHDHITDSEETWKIEIEL